MGIEIERKFRIRNDTWRSAVRASRRMIQGYLANTDRGSIRIRICGDTAALNIKSMTLGVTRSEFDYQVPLDEARTMLDCVCMRPLIKKTRHFVEHGGHTWEIDEFEAENAGLIVAELELAERDEAFERPPWLGEEVSDDPRFYNVCLVAHPYSTWNDSGSA